MPTPSLFNLSEASSDDVSVKNTPYCGDAHVIHWVLRIPRGNDIVHRKVTILKMLIDEAKKRLIQ
jgi:hypothetical protein